MRVTATIWAMNWTRTWVTISALMTTSRAKKHAKADKMPTKSTEKAGNCRFGCNRAKTLKNRPSAAAAYGTREYPRSTANKEASVVHSTSTVANWAHRNPYRRRMKSETIEVECTASVHGTTPIIPMFIVI